MASFIASKVDLEKGRIIELFASFDLLVATKEEAMTFLPRAIEGKSYIDPEGVEHKITQPGWYPQRLVTLITCPPGKQKEYLATVDATIAHKKTLFNSYGNNYVGCISLPATSNGHEDLNLKKNLCILMIQISEVF